MLSSRYSSEHCSTLIHTDTDMTHQHWSGHFNKPDILAIVFYPPARVQRPAIKFFFKLTETRCKLRQLFLLSFLSRLIGIGPSWQHLIINYHILIFCCQAGPTQWPNAPTPRTGGGTSLGSGLKTRAISWAQSKEEALASMRFLLDSE